jgi:uncharacterized protein DUF6894
MPRYFFNFRDENGLDLDEEGLEFSDLHAAYLEAFETAKEMWVEAIRALRDPSAQQFEINDERGITLLVVPLLEVLESLKARRALSAANMGSRNGPQSNA